ncbi:hypothetical protein IMZ48_29780 [Candidatus Bathyarchaeota archaeon]|nr:hypothetical protein [Candidatus Bathyarchaeota archaeon]
MPGELTGDFGEPTVDFDSPGDYLSVLSMAGGQNEGSLKRRNKERGTTITAGHTPYFVPNAS